MDANIFSMAMAHLHGMNPGLAHMMAAMHRLMTQGNPGMAHMMAAMSRLMAVMG